MQKVNFFMIVLGLAFSLGQGSLKAHQQVCEEMIVNYKVRLEKLKDDLEKYKDKVPLESIELVKESLNKVAEIITQVSQLSEKGLPHPECAALYTQVATQTKQIALKISRFSDLDVVPLSLQTKEEDAPNLEATGTPEK